MESQQTAPPGVPLSVVIIAGTEEENIAESLETVRWANEIVVVCSSREDATEEIAKRYTKNVFFREFEGFGPQRAYAMSLATHEWVLSIDADERVTDDLRDELQATLAISPPADGYYIPRKGYFLGKWMRHGGWYPDYQLRLFRKSKTRVSERLVHEGYLVDGRTEKLSHPLDHHTDPTIYHHLRKNLEYTRLEARERGKRVTALDLLLHPTAAFFKTYIGLGGWRDGAHGLAAALIHAAYNLQQYLYMWENSMKEKTEKSR